MKLKLKPTEARGVFEAQINGKPAIVALTTRNRCRQEFVTQSVTVPRSRLRKAMGLAGNKPLYVAIAVSVQGKFSQAFAVSHELWKKVRGGAHDFLLSDSSPAEYAKDDSVLN